MEIDIDRYGKKGHGTGDGYRVIGSVVGDRICASKIKRKQARLEKVISPSKERVTPRCRHSGMCGGCTWQQVSYSAQLKEKQNKIEELFGHEAAPIVACDDPFAYRNKMEFTFSENKAGERFLGLIIAGSRGHVLNLEECHLVSPWFIEVLKRVREWWEQSDLKAFHCHSNTGSLRTLTLREGIHTGEKLAMLTVSGNPDYAIPKPHLEGFVKAVGGGSVYVQIQQAIKGRPTQFYEMHSSGPDHIKEELNLNKTYRFKISPSSFFQPNTKQAEKLYALAVSLASLSKDMILLDLYCGTATLGIAFSSFVKKVIGIELNPYAVFDAEVNIEANGIDNVEVFKGDVGAALSVITERPDIVIVDPPRCGLDEKALKALIAFAPAQIIYISCNPSSQKENVDVLVAHGYKINTIAPVDQFPHTPHIENIVYLTC